MGFDTSVSVPPRSSIAEHTQVTTASGLNSFAATDVPSIATLAEPEMPDRFTALLSQGSAEVQTKDQDAQSGIEDAEGEPVQAHSFHGDIGFKLGVAGFTIASVGAFAVGGLYVKQHRDARQRLAQENQPDTELGQSSRNVPTTHASGSRQ